MTYALTDERTKKFKEVIAKRQNLTVILENVHDPHNIGAVMRSCDAVGISEIFILYTEASHNFLKQKVGKNTSSGARKWVKTHYFGEIEACFEQVRSKYSKIYGTHLGENSHSLYDLELTQPVALMFGNEQKGITEKARHLLDGNFIIPQFGMVQSLNISVACAVSLFEASRQRNEKKMYAEDYNPDREVHHEMFNGFVQKHFEQGNKSEK
jgi:tRNA (guanosine-2'-O-)-methyltransferase